MTINEKEMAMDINTVAQNAIGLFIEYEDKHGYSPDTAAAAALNEITEGTGDYILVSRENHAALIAALEAVLLFHSVDWTAAKIVMWEEITGTAEATTKVLCDTARTALAKARQ